MGRRDKAIELMEYAIGEINELIASATHSGTRILPAGATLVALEQEKFEFMGFLASLRSGLVREECSCGDHGEDDQTRVVHKADEQLGMDVDSASGCNRCLDRSNATGRAVELTDGPNLANNSISGAVEFEEGGKLRAAKDIRPGKQ